MASARSRLDEIAASFARPEDPRPEINRRHPPASVPVIAVPAILAGAAGPTAIARRAKLKRDFPMGLLDLPRGIPGKDAFRRALMTLEPDAFGACFDARAARLRDEAMAEAGIVRPVIALDGETARRGHDPADDLGALHVVTARAGEYGLAPGREACAEKSDEVAAIPELPRKIDVRGGAVTVDAMGAREAIAEAIIRGKADYVPAPGGNREASHRAVVAHAGEQLEGDLAAAREWVTTGRGHGRQERRIHPRLRAPGDLPGRGEWKGLRSIGVVTSQCLRDGEESIEARYYRSGLAADVALFARAVRGHWAVEGSCHRALDVTIREGDSRARERVPGSNVTRPCRFTPSILKRHPDRRQSLAMKRRGGGWSDTFPMEVVGESTC